MFALREVQCCHLRRIKGLSEVANYGWLPVVSRHVSGCREEGIRGELAGGEDESEISPVTPGKDIGGDGGRISDPDQTGSLTEL